MNLYGRRAKCIGRPMGCATGKLHNNLWSKEIVKALEPRKVWDAYLPLPTFSHSTQNCARSSAAIKRSIQPHHHSCCNLLSQDQRIDATGQKNELQFVHIYIVGCALAIWLLGICLEIPLCEFARTFWMELIVGRFLPAFRILRYDKTKPHGGHM